MYLIMIICVSAIFLLQMSAFAGEGRGYTTPVNTPPGGPLENDPAGAAADAQEARRADERAEEIRRELELMEHLRGLDHSPLSNQDEYTSEEREAELRKELDELTNPDTDTDSEEVEAGRDKLEKISKKDISDKIRKDERERTRERAATRPASHEASGGGGCPGH